MKAVKLGCIILAAGKSTRFGGVKQLYRYRRIPLVQRALDAANGSSADYVILVLGANNDKILETVNLGRTQILLNKEFESGISSSIKCGVSNLPDDCAGCILMVADQPRLTSNHLNKLVEKFKEGNLRDAVALSHDKEPRNPVLVPKRLFPQLLKLRGDSGARNIIRGLKELRLVEVSDKKVFLDIDTKPSAKVKIQTRVKLRI